MTVSWSDRDSSIYRRQTDGRLHDPDSRGTHAGDQYLYKRIGFSCVVRGGLAWKPIASDDTISTSITTGVPPRFRRGVRARQPTLQLIYDVRRSALRSCRGLPLLQVNQRLTDICAYPLRIILALCSGLRTALADA